MPRPLAARTLIVNSQLVAPTGGFLYVNGVAQVSTSGAQTITGNKTFKNVVEASGVKATGLVVDNHRFKFNNGKFYLDSFNSTTFDTGARPISGVIVERELFPGVYGSVNSIDWSQCYLYDTFGGVTVDWSGRKFYNDSPSMTLDWQNRILSGNWQCNTLPTLSGHVINKGFYDLNTVKLTGNQVVSGVKTFPNGITIGDGTAITIDSSVAPLFLDVNFGFFYATKADNSQFPAIIFTEASGPDTIGIYDHLGGRSISFTGRELIDEAGASAVNWQARTLDDVGGDASLYWEERILEGSWVARTPTLPSGVANRAYVDSGSSSIVYKTGAQTISGTKTFKGDFYAGSGTLSNSAIKVINGVLTITTAVGNEIYDSQSNFWKSSSVSFGGVDVENCRLIPENGEDASPQSLDWNLRLQSGRWTQQAVVAVETAAPNQINWISGNLFHKTLTGNQTFTFTGDINGQSIQVITYSTGNFTVTWPTGIKWPGGIAFSGTSGSAATGKYDRWEFLKSNDIILGSYSPNHY